MKKSIIPPPVSAVALPLGVAVLGSILLLYTVFGLLLLFFGLADTHGRYRDFRYLSTGPLTTRLAAFYGKSMCGRGVVTAIDPLWKERYYIRGYRWYHILPDNSPRVFLNPRFWGTLVLGHVK